MGRQRSGRSGRFVAATNMPLRLHNPFRVRAKDEGGCMVGRRGRGGGRFGSVKGF